VSNTFVITNVLSANRVFIWIVNINVSCCPATAWWEKWMENVCCVARDILCLMVCAITTTTKPITKHHHVTLPHARLQTPSYRAAFHAMITHMSINKDAVNKWTDSAVNGCRMEGVQHVFKATKSTLKMIRSAFYPNLPMCRVKMQLMVIEMEDW